MPSRVSTTQTSTLWLLAKSQHFKQWQISTTPLTLCTRKTTKQIWVLAMTVKTCQTKVKNKYLGSFWKKVGRSTTLDSTAEFLNTKNSTCASTSTAFEVTNLTSPTTNTTTFRCVWRLRSGLESTSRTCRKLRRWTWSEVSYQSFKKRFQNCGSFNSNTQPSQIA
jgi:hypothetical protein